MMQQHNVLLSKSDRLENNNASHSETESHDARDFSDTTLSENVEKQPCWVVAQSEATVEGGQRAAMESYYMGALAYLQMHCMQSTNKPEPITELEPSAQQPCAQQEQANVLQGQISENIIAMQETLLSHTPHKDKAAKLFEPAMKAIIKSRQEMLSFLKELGNF